MLRVSIYIFGIIVTGAALSFSVLLGAEMNEKEVNIWVTTQFINHALDFTILPFIKISFSAVFIFAVCPGITH